MVPLPLPPVIVKADGKLLMAVLSANDRVDLETLQNETQSTILRLATEDARAAVASLAL